MERSIIELRKKIDDSKLPAERKRAMELYVLRKFGKASDGHINWLDQEQMYRNLYLKIKQEIKSFNFKAQYGGTECFEQYELDAFLRSGPYWFEDLYRPEYWWRTPALWRKMKRAVILYNKRRPHVYLTEYFEAMAEKCWQ